MSIGSFLAKTINTVYDCTKTSIVEFSEGLAEGALGKDVKSTTKYVQKKISESTPAPKAEMK